MYALFMNLYSIVVVELRDKIASGTVAGEEVMLALGGIPAAECEGPWSDEQINLVKTAVYKWFDQIPEKLTKLHRQQRQRVKKQLSSNHYYFLFEFSTGDAIDLDSFMQDTSALFNVLKQDLEDSDMVVSKFDSI